MAKEPEPKPEQRRSRRLGSHKGPIIAGQHSGRASLAATNSDSPQIVEKGTLPINPEDPTSGKVWFSNSDQGRFIGFEGDRVSTQGLNSPDLDLVTQANAMLPQEIQDRLRRMGL